MLSLITSQIELKKGALLEIYEGLLNSSSENVKQFAATIILDNQPTRTELKPIVLKALNSQRWDIRSKAISALSKVQKTTAEENQLLEKIGDDDGDVRKQVVTLLQQKQLGDASVPDLAKQMKSQNWEVRRDAALLLSKINSDQAVLVLISQMNDEDSDVKTKIYSLLAVRNLTNDSVSTLKKNFSSQSWDVRRDVAKLLGKIKTADSLAALEEQLTKETDSDVKNQILASIKTVKN